MSKQLRITRIADLGKGNRHVAHYTKYCAAGGTTAEAIFSPAGGKEYCVNCDAGLNELGQKIMRRSVGETE